MMNDEKKPQDQGTDFGMIDLGGEPAASSESSDGAAAAVPDSAGGQAAASGAPDDAPTMSEPAVPSSHPDAQAAEDKQPPARPHPRYEPITAPPRPLIDPRTLKIIALVTLLVAALAGGIYGIVQWRASVAAEKRAEQEKLNSRSLDNLRDQAVRTDGI